MLFYTKSRAPFIILKYEVINRCLLPACSCHRPHLRKDKPASTHSSIASCASSQRFQPLPPPPPPPPKACFLLHWHLNNIFHQPSTFSNLVRALSGACFALLRRMIQSRKTHQLEPQTTAVRREEGSEENLGGGWGLVME